MTPKKRLNILLADNGAVVWGMAGGLCKASHTGGGYRQQKDTKPGEALLTPTRSLIQRNGTESTPVLTRGNAATGIFGYDQGNQIDLIAAGSRGLSQFRSLRMGSISHKPVHDTNGSVLIVEGPKKE